MSKVSSIAFVKVELFLQDSESQLLFNFKRPNWPGREDCCNGVEKVHLGQVHELDVILLGNNQCPPAGAFAMLDPSAAAAHRGFCPYSKPAFVAPPAQKTRA